MREFFVSTIIAFLILIYSTNQRHPKQRAIVRLRNRRLLQSSGAERGLGGMVTIRTFSDSNSGMEIVSSPKLGFNIVGGEMRANVTSPRVVTGI